MACRIWQQYLTNQELELNMLIDELLAVLPAPKNPVEVNASGWGAITDSFGQSLPNDYMKFIDCYGSGEIGGWLTVLNPFSRHPNISLKEQFFSLLSTISQLKSEFPESCPFPLLLSQVAFCHGVFQ